MIAFDLATVTGWATHSGSTLLNSGFERLGKVGEPWPRLQSALLWLPSLLGPVAWGRGDVAYERPMERGRNRAAIVCSLQLETALILACQARGIPQERVHAYHLGTVKKAATGSGRASKDEVIEAMRERWGYPALKDDNEADALAVLHLHLERRAA